MIITLEKDLKIDNSFIEEEKKKKKAEQNKKCYDRLNKIGGQTIKQFAGILLKNMKHSSKIRGHEEVSWTVNDIIKLLKEKKDYIVFGTVLKDLIFPLELTNGYHNTATFDRIDDNKGYFITNVEIRAHFLNTRYKLKTEDIKNIIEVRMLNQDKDKLINISKNINLTMITDNPFYDLAKHIRGSKTARN